MGYADRKSTRLNSSHLGISYAVFCLKKKKKKDKHRALMRERPCDMYTPADNPATEGPPHVACALRVPVAPLVFSFLFFFFLKNRAPPNFSLFPHPPLFRL